jgi:hypothetical protein
MDNNLGNISWQNIGIEIDDLNKTLENPDTVDMPSGVYHGRDYSSVVKPKSNIEDTSMVKRALWVCFITIVIGIIMVSFMARNAEAGAAFMQFTVVSVTDKIIQVEDEHGDTFTFHADKSPEVEVGQEVIVATDLTYVSGGGWKWNTKRTAIIDIVK